MTFFISHVISTRAIHISPIAQRLIWVLGWYDIVILNMPYHNVSTIYFNVFILDLYYFSVASSYSYLSAFLTLMKHLARKRSLQWKRINYWLIADNAHCSYLCFCFSFDLWSQQCHHSLHNEHFPCFLRYQFWQ